MTPIAKAMRVADWDCDIFPHVRIRRRKLFNDSSGRQSFRRRLNPLDERKSLDRHSQRNTLCEPVPELTVSLPSMKGCTVQNTLQYMVKLPLSLATKETL
jgi:hypothetical protein